MKIILSALLLLLIPSIAFGYNAAIYCASTTIGTSYSSTPPGLPTTLTLIPMPYKPSISVVNNSNTRICVNTSTLSAASPPLGGNGQEYCTPPQTMSFLDGVNVPGKIINVYVRADVATCTSGTVDISVW